MGPLTPLTHTIAFFPFSKLIFASSKSSNLLLHEIPCNDRYYHRKKPRCERASHRFVLGIKISINGKQDKAKGDDDGDDCDVKDQHESTDGSAACPVSTNVSSSGTLAPDRWNAELVEHRGHVLELELELD